MKYCVMNLLGKKFLKKRKKKKQGYMWTSTGEKMLLNPQNMLFNPLPDTISDILTVGLELLITQQIVHLTIFDPTLYKGLNV